MIPNDPIPWHIVAPAIGIAGCIAGVLMLVALATTPKTYPVRKCATGTPEKIEKIKARESRVLEVRKRGYREFTICWEYIPK